MAHENEPESLWLFGDPEPWRRGRNILLTIGLFYAALQGALFFGALFLGALEMAFSLALVLVLWWLAFAFIWFGTHWLRWLLGGGTMLTGFALFIWGIRDQSILQWSAGVIDLLIGAFCFAPSVHFFAVRQKEHIRWPEKLAAAVIFVLLLVSFFTALLGVNAYRAATQREATHYGEEAFRRIFVENDTAFLLEEANARWKERDGNLGVTAPLTDKAMRLGDVTNTRVTNVALLSFYQFPSRIDYRGVIDGYGSARCGQVSLRLQISRPSGAWQIDGFWWKCPGY
ncbi:MAG: hypothetical protein M3Y86_02715 [Verrucomicrobiota bacterium]|nr:hypothetical protein [Verrucomicrobiota bacterium]